MKRNGGVGPTRKGRGKYPVRVKNNPDADLATQLRSNIYVYEKYSNYITDIVGFFHLPGGFCPSFQRGFYLKY